MSVYDRIPHSPSDLFGRNVILSCQHFKSLYIELEVKYAFITVDLLSYCFGRIIDIYESENWYGIWMDFGEDDFENEVVSRMFITKDGKSRLYV